MHVKDFLFPASLSTLAFARDGKRRRESSYDRAGGNDDRLHLAPGTTSLLMAAEKPGLITHIWVTIAPEDRSTTRHLRELVLRMFWDGEDTASVEVPMGDFFGMGHAQTRNFVSAPLQMSPEDGKGFNCWFPMPYEKARIEVENPSDQNIIFYYYIDYEEYDALPPGLLRFHAQWRRENLTDGIEWQGLSNRFYEFGGQNTDGAGNYVIMEAQGKGHYVGCNLNIDNRRNSGKWDWPGEGDDMIFIDGEPWPPRLHGTGTEDYVNMSWCPTQPYSAPYHGLILGGGNNWKGPISYYRYHIQDPVMFETSIKVTIEHGHNNHRSDDWSSTAYWYQTEPHMPFPALPDVPGRLPLTPLDDEQTE